MAQDITVYAYIYTYFVIMIQIYGVRKSCTCTLYAYLHAKTFCCRSPFTKEEKACILYAFPDTSMLTISCDLEIIFLD